MRERYPALFDSDTSDDESDGSGLTPSRKASFSFSSATKSASHHNLLNLKPNKAVRLDPPIENLEGLSIPRSTSTTSLHKITPSRAAIAAAAQLRRTGSLRRSNSTRSIQPSTRRSFIDTCPMDAPALGPAPGPAQPSFHPHAHHQQHQHQQHQHQQHQHQQHHQPTHDLDALGLAPPDWPARTTSSLAPALLATSHASSGTLDAHNRRWSLLSGSDAATSASRGPSISPTHSSSRSQIFYPTNAPAAAAPPAAVAAAAPRRIRCVCGGQASPGKTSPRGGKGWVEDGEREWDGEGEGGEEALVQCRSCTQWSHAACVEDGRDGRGGGRGGRARGGFTCFLCTMPPPVTPVGTRRR